MAPPTPTARPPADEIGGRLWFNANTLGRASTPSVVQNTHRPSGSPQLRRFPLPGKGMYEITARRLPIKAICPNVRSPRSPMHRNCLQTPAHPKRARAQGRNAQAMPRTNGIPCAGTPETECLRIQRRSPNEGCELVITFLITRPATLHRGRRICRLIRWWQFLSRWRVLPRPRIQRLRGRTRSRCQCWSTRLAHGR